MVTLGLSVERGTNEPSRNESEAVEPRNYYLKEEVDTVLLVADKII